MLQQNKLLSRKRKIDPASWDISIIHAGCQFCIVCICAYIYLFYSLYNTCYFYNFYDHFYIRDDLYDGSVFIYLFFHFIGIR